MFRFLLAALALAAASAHAGEGSVWDRSARTDPIKAEITVYSSPYCGCCGDWVDHLRRHGFTVNSIHREDMGAVKRELGVPADLASCHTAVVDGYLVEGHVPADDIKRLLRSKDKRIAGITVPRMPVGSPGMEDGSRRDAFAVIAFDKGGRFWRYRHYETY